MHLSNNFQNKSKRKSKAQLNLKSQWPIVAIAHKALRFSQEENGRCVEKFQNSNKEKRTSKGGQVSHDILAREEVVIQRLSAEVSGKAQKYSRIGPREFAPYDYEEMTLPIIKTTCKETFRINNWK